MRIDKETADFIKTGLEGIASGSKIYLFGSRVDDTKKGGDIDILWLTPMKVPQHLIRKFRVNFYRNFGWQKIDIVNFKLSDQDVFKDISLSNAIML